LVDQETHVSKCGKKRDVPTEWASTSNFQPKQPQRAGRKASKTRVGKKTTKFSGDCQDKEIADLRARSSGPGTR